MVDLAEFLKALSDETRLRIMALLYQKEMCVCEICDVIGESQPKVSRHLAKLRDADLVRDERQSQWVFYYLNLENKTASEIMNTIIRNINEHSILNEDMQKLNEKVKQCKLCKREGK
ncbi:transcriptional regulator, ArsR family [Caloramator quimbayensis]|uniref:Transcriptional regulator, ArsR family n=1 Tax=Caloramator quimbayensis TaxID=1147123 RepID=A0A1T4YFX0_9CLOT|nr:metalloregulator ArsR/SmtB family transcription factor [Caloramator quimbayensis]SKB00664.1 transcriptional regulator, ArsR family [Caloramator quimbayensis]